MKNVIYEKAELLSQLIVELYEKRYLKKVIFSKPEKSDEIKTILTPKVLKDKQVMQFELLTKDNKAYHQNVTDYCIESVRDNVNCHSQINVISSVGDIQYMVSKSGKETLLGAGEVEKKLECDTCENEHIEYGGNNKEKKYILSGKEEFLKQLGISDEQGRVHDKAQSKFRQINKFLDQIESVVRYLPQDDITVYDLCCGKSYLSFAAYYYFKSIKNMDLEMICIDLKSDVIEYCSSVASRLGFDKMQFVCSDINEYPIDGRVDLVISLHACDIATDIVIDKAIASGAKVILSTPCCHHELNHKLNCKELSFITKHSMLRQKLADSATDALRLLRLEYSGYDAHAVELIDPEDTPKNILLKAVYKGKPDKEKERSLKEEYSRIYSFLTGE